MKLFLVFISFLIYTSCNYKSTCDSEGLLGEYHVDLTVVTSYNNNDTSILSLIKGNNLDKIKLIAQKNKYYFEEDEDILKMYEGTWEYNPIGLEGDCYVFINQNKLSRSLPLIPFNILVQIDGKEFILPFKKSE